MSYILDALRRADSERERGAVPGLHAQPGTESPDTTETAHSAATNPLVWVVVAMALLLVAVLAWQTLAPTDDAGDAARPGADERPPASAATPRVASPAPAETARWPATKSASASAAAATSAAAPPTLFGAASAAAKLPPLSLPAIPAPAPPLQAAAPARVAPGAVPLLSAAPSPSPLARSPAAGASAETRLAAPAELPPEIQRQLPKLAIGGSVYSSQPAGRFVVINGQVFHEGDKPATDLVLEQIGLKSAVLNFKGHRYEIVY